jgi:dienelactone hydrolase/Tol biopolymer transport system component
MTKRKTLINKNNIKSLFTAQSVQYMFVAQNKPHKAIVVSNRFGNYQLYAVDFNTGFNRQITSNKQGTIFGSISSDGNYIYILEDKKGNELGHFKQISFEGGKSIDITPNLEPYFSYSVSTNDNAEIICFVASIKDKNKVFVVSKNKKHTFNVYEIYGTKNSLTEPVCASDGSMICVAETFANSNKSRLIFFLISNNCKNLKTIYSKKFDSIIPLSFLKKQGKRVLLALVRYNNWYRPIMYDVLNGRFSKINHPLFRGDIWALLWNEKNNQLVLCDVYHAEQKLYLYDINTKRLRRIGPKIGSFNFHFGSMAMSQDESFIIRWSDFNTPPCLITIHAPKYNTWSKIPEWSSMITSRYETKNIYIKSPDKNRVQMWMVCPTNKKTPLPFIIDVHGGPHSVVFNEFSPEAHAWLKNGFGYCAVNYRGSISFGKKFERKIYGNPGHWEVEDIVTARNWLVKKKYANPKFITLYGWSWGGYITLLALGKYPNLWGSGIACNGIVDFIMQYEDEPGYFKAQDRELFKGTPKTAVTRYVRSSPMTYTKNIQAPLLIIHGEDDVRCPPRQIKHFINVLKKYGKQFDIVWFKSGHIGGFTNINLRVSLINKAIRFAIEVQKNRLSRKSS